MISIFGLGYVGSVMLGCLAKRGFDVIGVDPDRTKTNLISSGKSPLMEKDVGKYISQGVKKGLIKVTENVAEAVSDSEISLICVGTPKSKNGSLNIQNVYNVAEEIGASLKNKKQYHTIVINSTVMPGTNEKVCEIISLVSGKKKNVNFGVVSNPEFLREGSSVEDYLKPEIVIIGTESKKSQKKMANLYSPVCSNIQTVPIKLAETIKLINNSFHALKVTFANEVGNICKNLNIDSHELMALFCADKKQNMSKMYFKPGFAFGGSCLLKDLNALQNLSTSLQVPIPIIDSIEKSNEAHKQYIITLIESSKKNKIGFIGVSFKPGTDDIRNSPTVDLVEKLTKSGYRVNAYDKSLEPSNLRGANRKEIISKIPYLNNIFKNDILDVVKNSEIIVISHPDRSIIPYFNKYPNKTFIDLVRIDPKLKTKGNYIGLSW